MKWNGSLVCAVQLTSSEGVQKYIPVTKTKTNQKLFLRYVQRIGQR